MNYNLIASSRSCLFLIVERHAPSKIRVLKYFFFFLDKISKIVLIQVITPQIKSNNSLLKPQRGNSNFFQKIFIMNTKKLNLEEIM